ncbi:Pre-mRNA-splicing factor Cwf15/Cwc15 [Triangularia setosa]|uniref:Pre-mRNA-splicing factor Cwf15/Cwc15 n=1 Tax=Triangularia setosa TaxID=2587417 RepID=A0AAN6WCU7_9PEZI|nr:Pre-mRNA-splicing factor Cwf15/Cwc15 [Podospora setosa]
MTTAHRPTFDPARGKEALRGPAYHQRLLPAYTQLKFRQPGQGGDADSHSRDLRAELEAAEAAHYAKLKGAPIPGQPTPSSEQQSLPSSSSKRPLEIAGNPSSSLSEEDDPGAKRRRILEETRAIDADDSDASSEEDEEEDDDDSDSDSDSDDEEAELQRELERVRRERAEKREREEKERLAAEEAEREKDIALGNPLLNSNTNRADFNIKRRWDDDVVFKNQARGTEEKGKKKEFINDLLRSDFHKRFMSKYVR